jgi:limonene-1,2-epoxide hydrolase
LNWINGAIYGLHRTALVDKETFGSDIKKFVLNHFYLDDELISVHTVDEAIYILKRTRMALLVHGNLRLHKFASSSKEVMTEFPSDDLTKDL